MMKKLLIPLLLAGAIMSTQHAFATDLTASSPLATTVNTAATYVSSGTAVLVSRIFTTPGTQSIDPPSGGLLTPSYTLSDLSFETSAGIVSFSGSELPPAGQRRHKKIPGTTCTVIVLDKDLSGNYTFRIDCIVGV